MLQNGHHRIHHLENVKPPKRIDAAYAGGLDGEEKAGLDAMRRHQQMLTKGEW